MVQKVMPGLKIVSLGLLCRDCNYKYGVGSGVFGSGDDNIGL
jgi:hypothetical protein